MDPPNAWLPSAKDCVHVIGGHELENTKRIWASLAWIEASRRGPALVDPGGLLLFRSQPLHVPDRLCCCFHDSDGDIWPPNAGV